MKLKVVTNYILQTGLFSCGAYIEIILSLLMCL